MVGLVAALEPAEDRNRVLDARLSDVHLLESPLQGRVLLDPLAVLVQRGGADHAQLASREHGLEHVARVHGALGRAGTDDGVQLVDERDDLALGLLDLGQHGLEPLLELAPVLGAGHHGPEVQGDEALVTQRLRDVAVDHALRQAFDDGGLADAGLPDEHRVVLRPPAQHLHDPPDLGVSSDHRVHRAVASAGGQVDAVLLQSLVLPLRVGAGDLGRAAHLGERLREPLRGGPRAGQQVTRG